MGTWCEDLEEGDEGKEQALTMLRADAMEYCCALFLMSSQGVWVCAVGRVYTKGEAPACIKHVGLVDDSEPASTGLGCLKRKLRRERCVHKRQGFHLRPPPAVFLNVTPAGAFEFALRYTCRHPQLSHRLSSASQSKCLAQGETVSSTFEPPFHDLLTSKQLSHDDHIDSPRYQIVTQRRGVCERRIYLGRAHINA